MAKDDLTKQQCAQIKSLMREDRWDAVVRFLELKLTQWRAEPVVGSTAFEELRSLHRRDGKVDGVLEFFEQLERQALDD